MKRGSLFGQLRTVFTLLLPIIYIVLGVLLFFIGNKINTEVFAILLGGILMIMGAALIIHYFLSHAYMDMNAYGFSIGTLAVILGVCILIKSEAVGESLSMFLNVCIMLTAIIKLQNAIQLKFLKHFMWIPVLCISLVFIGCTILLAVCPFEEAVRDKFTYIVLLCDGIVSFANAIVLRIVMRRHMNSAQTNIVQA